MSELMYRYRAHPWARAQTFRLGKSALLICDGKRKRSMPYNRVTFIEAFDVGFLGSRTRYWQHILRTPDKPPVVLGSGFRDRWRVADQRAEYQPFISALMKTVDEASPDRDYIHGRQLLNRAGGLGGKLAVQMLRLVRHSNPDRWASVAAWIMRRVGPWLRGHRRALDQLALAFPEKSTEEREKIAVGMWDNLARTVVEYAQLETYWRKDPGADPDNAGTSRVVVDAASQSVLAGIKKGKRRTLHFSLHSANWELCACAAPQHDVKRLIPYRRLKNEPLTTELVRIRTAAGTTPLTAGPSIILQIKKEFREGDALGMLIDQHYVRGIEVTFFGRPTMLNPLFARLVRIYDCPMYGSRIIRRSDGRFGYEIVGPIEPVRDARGRVDVHATTQLCVSTLEQWIREYPEQWMWLHRAWR
ncbi:MAG: lipid A biosynthesis lauroyl acyltransferase [Rhizobiales bacterium]|nr:lipid A biosynthesis lauroyl acyltransferase [Hyphomicrobiales bacterium]